jgi:hypothetical protein
MAFSVEQPIVLVSTLDHAIGRQGKIMNNEKDGMGGRSILEVDEQEAQEFCILQLSSALSFVDASLVWPHTLASTPPPRKDCKGHMDMGRPCTK